MAHFGMTRKRHLTNRIATRLRTLAGGDAGAGVILMLAAVLAFWAVQWQGPDGAFARSIREVAARLP